MDNDKIIATTVDAFEPSLWNFIGQYKSKFALISLVDQLVNDRLAGRNVEFPVVLITGATGIGKRTLAKALHNACGNLVFKETASVLGTTEDHCDFFNTSTDFTTFYITNFTLVSVVVVGALVCAFRDKYFYQQAMPGSEKKIISVGNKLIILSADGVTMMNPDVLKHVGVRCYLAPYSLDHIYQILKQRINILNWKASETTLKLIAQNSKNNPEQAMKLLQNTYMIARSEDRDKININHAKKALVLIS